MTNRYDPDRAEHVAELQRSHKLREQQALADWRWLTHTPQGQRVLASLMVEFGLYAPTFVGGDALGSAYREGMRGAALRLYTAVTTAGQGAVLAALMAEVMQPANVRDANPRPSTSE